MNKQCQFTKEQLKQLRQNLYVLSVTGSRLALTKEFKEIFYSAYQSGEIPRQILADHGLDPAILSDRRILGISCRIRSEYKKYGEFHQGSRTPKTVHNSCFISPPFSSEKDELKQLRHEVDYLKQEIAFLKKFLLSEIFRIRCTVYERFFLYI